MEQVESKEDEYHPIPEVTQAHINSTHTRTHTHTHTHTHTPNLTYIAGEEFKNVRGTIELPDQTTH